MNRLKKMVLAGLIAWGSFLIAPLSVAQVPLVTATGPEVQAHGGFEFIGQQVPATTGRLGMYGANSGMTVGVSRRFGLRFDLGYARANNVMNTGHHSDILSYMAGPVFYPVRSERFSPYAELLLGGARVTGVTPDGNGGWVRGYANEFAWAGGGGLEFRTSRTLAMRIGADYLRTQYFDPSVALVGQGNVRGVVTFIYYLGGRRR